MDSGGDVIDQRRPQWTVGIAFLGADLAVVSDLQNVNAIWILEEKKDPEVQLKLSQGHVRELTLRVQIQTQWKMKLVSVQKALLNKQLVQDFFMLRQLKKDSRKNNHEMHKLLASKLKTVYPEGTHPIIPWFERPIIYDVCARPKGVDSIVGSRDLQMVRIALRVLTCPEPDQLPTIYRTFGMDYVDRVMPSIVHETLKAVVAQYNASQLITQRETVSREIRGILRERAAKFNIAMDDVSITRLTFGIEFMTAIEAKQVAAQEAERTKYVVEKAEQDKKSAIIRAQGEAKSAQLIGEAIANNPAFVTLRKIEAGREIAKDIANQSLSQL